MAKGKLVTINPDGSEVVTRIESAKEPSLPVLQKAVGGYIELVAVRYEDRIREAYVDEEGYLNHRTPNPKATEMYQAAHIGSHCRICGPLVIWVPDPKKETAK
jgi:Domain of unknown function (DUF3846)